MISNNVISDLKRSNDIKRKWDRMKGHKVKWEKIKCCRCFIGPALAHLISLCHMWSHLIEYYLILHFILSHLISSEIKCCHPTPAASPCLIGPTLAHLISFCYIWSHLISLYLILYLILSHLIWSQIKCSRGEPLPHWLHIGSLDLIYYSHIISCYI